MTEPVTTDGAPDAPSTAAGPADAWQLTLGRVDAVGLLLCLQAILEGRPLTTREGAAVFALQRSVKTQIGGELLALLEDDAWVAQTDALLDANLATMISNLLEQVIGEVSP